MYQCAFLKITILLLSFTAMQETQYKYLDKVDSPDDLKRLRAGELTQPNTVPNCAASSLRSFHRTRGTWVEFGRGRTDCGAALCAEYAG